MRRLLESLLSESIPDNHTDAGVESLRKIDDDICIFLRTCDPTICEKVVLLINHIIIMDKLSECGRTTWENDDRHLYMHDLLVVLKDFGSCSSSLKLKEIVYYYAACLCFKVHNYEDALRWFKESKNVYEKNTARDELHEIERVRRDIFIAFCYEYMGYPEKAIVFLLGISSIDIFETAIYAHKNDIITAVVKTECKKNKYFLINTIFSFAEFSCENAFTTLIKKDGTSRFEEESAELVHVFAHCLSEYKTKAYDFENDNYGKFKYDSLIRLISTRLIDTLDDKYITCKATIRAEGNDQEAALEILPETSKITNKKEAAEINFYRFYFTELFSDINESSDDGIISAAGQEFHDYCVSGDSGLDVASKRDALLHYHIFEVKHKLRIQFENILKESTNRNASFMEIDFENIDNQWKDSFYAVTQRSDDFREGFSSFANDEIKKELSLLHLCLNILLEMKANELPLFFTNDEEGKDFIFEVNSNQLFELCKMFSSLFLSEIRPILKSHNITSSKHRTYYINNIRFDISGDYYSEFEGWIQELFDNKQVEYENVELTKQSSTTKIVFGDEEYVENLCEDYCRELTNNPGLNIRVFYVGSKSDAFIATPIAAFSDLKTCVLMAFIYATVEYVIEYICKPRPIYILAPLRDTGSYYFQAVNLERFIPLYHELSEARIINSEGIGITTHFCKPKTTEKFVCSFASQEVKQACCCAIIYKDDKLFALRKDDFIEKTNVHRLLIQACYDNYANYREKCRRCSTVHTDGKHKCSSNNTRFCDYVFRKTDSLANKSARNNPIAKQLLLELIVVACREEVSDYDNLYVLENNIMIGAERSRSFFIYFFNKDLSILGCPKNWFTTGKAPNDNDGINNVLDIIVSEETSQYQRYINSLCNALKKRQSEALVKWSIYRTEHSENYAAVADNKIELLNKLDKSIKDLEQEWLQKSPLSCEEINMLKKAFRLCEAFTMIENKLNEADFVTEG